MNRKYVSFGILAVLFSLITLQSGFALYSNDRFLQSDIDLDVGFSDTNLVKSSSFLENVFQDTARFGTDRFAEGSFTGRRQNLFDSASTITRDTQQLNFDDNFATSRNFLTGQSSSIRGSISQSGAGSLRDFFSGQRDVSVGGSSCGTFGDIPLSSYERVSYEISDGEDVYITRFGCGGPTLRESVATLFDDAQRNDFSQTEDFNQQNLDFNSGSAVQRRATSFTKGFGFNSAASTSRSLFETSAKIGFQDRVQSERTRDILQRSQQDSQEDFERTINGRFGRGKEIILFRN